MQTEGQLRSLLRRHKKRVLIASLIGAVGSALLFGGVSGLHLDAKLVNMGLSPLMTILAFFAYKHWVFPDRETSTRSGLVKWSVKWAVMFAVNQSYFVWLIGDQDISFMTARVVVAASTALPAYAISNLVVFARTDSKLVRVANVAWFYSTRLAYGI
jgi:hypothetical protein